MERLILTCDCCGKEFYSKYWTGGYIDHVTNFSSRHRSYTDKSAERIARDIMFHGNSIRTVYDIVIRFNCFMTWRTVSDETKTEVKRIVDEMVKLLKDAEEKARVIKNSTPPMVLAMLNGDDLDGSFREAFNSIVGKEVEE